MEIWQKESFNSLQIPMEIMRNKKKYDGSVKISLDMKAKQRTYLNDLRNKLNDMSDDTKKFRGLYYLSI